MPEESVSTSTPETSEPSRTLVGGAAGAVWAPSAGSVSQQGPPGPSRKRPEILSRWRCTSIPASVRASAVWMRTSIKRAVSAWTWCGGRTTTSARRRSAIEPLFVSTARLSLPITGTSIGCASPPGPWRRAITRSSTLRSTPPRTAAKCWSLPSAQSNAAWATHCLQARSQNAVYSTSYSDTTLELDIYPQQLGADARVLVEILSSYRPPSAGRPAGQYRIQYRLGDGVGFRTEEGGLLGIVGLPAPPPNAWHRLRIVPREDHAVLWPDTVADDASLRQLNLGLMVRQGAGARVVFDRLRFLRTRSDSASANALQQRAINAYRQRYPGVTQYAASEISLVTHLNAYGGTGKLPTYSSANAVMNRSVTAQRDMIRWLGVRARQFASTIRWRIWVVTRGGSPSG